MSFYANSFGNARFRAVPQSSTGRPGRFQRNRAPPSHGGGPHGVPQAASTSQLDNMAATSEAQEAYQSRSTWRQPADDRNRTTRLRTVLSLPSLQDGCRTGAPGLEDEEQDTSDPESVLSDFDLVNDTIQEYLLASDNSDEDSAFSGDFGDGTATATATLYISALLPVGSANLERHQRRKRMAKKAASSSALSAHHTRRMQGSASTGSLLALDMSIDGVPESESRQKRQKRRVVQIRPGMPSSSSPAIDAGKAAVTHQRSALLRSLKPYHRGIPVGPLTIVLDVDETLVAARDGPIHVRPHVKTLLDLCEQLRCEIIVWTAGVPSYVNPILHSIADVCGRKAWFHHIISRHRRWFRDDGEREASGVKDLVLLGRPLERVLLLENNPISVRRQPMNAILVEDYLFPNDKDDALRSMAGIVHRAVARMSSGGGGVSSLIGHGADEEALAFTRGDGVKQRPSPCTGSRTEAALYPAPEPMLTPLVPLSDCLDLEDALTFADFELAAEESEEDGENALPPRERRGERRCEANERLPVRAGERTCQMAPVRAQHDNAEGHAPVGPQLPRSSFFSGFRAPSVTDEEVCLEEAGRHRRGGAQPVRIGPALGPTVTGDPKAEGCHGTPSVVRCRVLCSSPLSPHVCLRSYGCMNPVSN